MSDTSPPHPLLQGKPLAIARAISAVENGTPAASDIVRLIQPHLGKALVLGVTGPPGAGKSSLTNALIAELVKCGRKVAVVAVDPTSPISGGALLGDRVRMAAHSRNPNVFIRSLATKGHLGGLTRMTSTVVDVLDAAGMDVVIIETVGTGQSEIDVADLAHVKLVICPPGLGDDMQAIKAGVLEIADILVVNKADLPGADETALQLKHMLHSAGDARNRTVMKTSSTTGEGVTDLVAAVEGRFAALRSGSGSDRLDGTFRTRRMLATLAAAHVSELVRGFESSEIEKLCSAVQAGDIAPAAAVSRILGLVAVASDSDPPPAETEGVSKHGA